jgi:hypothetical protein
MKKAHQAKKYDTPVEQTGNKIPLKLYGTESSTNPTPSGYQPNGVYIAPLIPHPSLIKQTEIRTTEQAKSPPRKKKVLSPEELERQDTQLLFKAWIYLFILVALGLIVSSGVLH